MGKRIHFITSNSVKFNVAKEYLEKKQLDIELIQTELDIPEIQDTSVESVALASARFASQHIKEPFILSDVGFRIAALNGFPGPFIKYMNDWLKPTDLVRLVDDSESEDRSACFVDALAYGEPSKEPAVFSSETTGRIVEKTPFPEFGWIFDAVFVPDGHSKLLAEMEEDEILTIWNEDHWDKIVEHIHEKAVWTGQAEALRDHVIVENQHQPTTMNMRTFITHQARCCKAWSKRSIVRQK